MSTAKHTHQLHASVGKRADRPAHPVSHGKTTARQTERPFEEASDGFSSILKTLPLSLGVTALTAMAFLTALAFVAYFSPDPMPLTPVLSAAALALASMVGGFVAGRLNTACPLGASLLAGGLTAATLLLLALLPGESGGFLSLLLRPAVLPCHLLGGIISRPRKKAPVHTAVKHPAHR